MKCAFLRGRDFAQRDNEQMIMTSEYLLARGHCCHSPCQNCPYKKQSQPDSCARVICLVPSLTETLINAGVHVVGRTRYCIHPDEKVRDIKVVGGTKDLRLSIIEALNPDIIIFDKEENTKVMAEMVQHLPNCRMHVTHVVDLVSLANELTHLSTLLENQILKQYSERIIYIADKMKNVTVSNTEIFNNFFKYSIIKWWRPITDTKKQQMFSYFIWKKPTMIIDKGTFISDIFKLVLPSWEIDNMGVSDGGYLKVDLYKLSDSTLFLFSSEPYPFEGFEAEFLADEQLTQSAALIDGEKLSWFGIRSLRFLEDVMNDTLLTHI